MLKHTCGWHIPRSNRPFSSPEVQEPLLSGGARMPPHTVGIERGGAGEDRRKVLHTRHNGCYPCRTSWASLSRTLREPNHPPLPFPTYLPTDRQMAPHFGPRGGGKLLSTTSPPIHVLPGFSYRPTVDTHNRIGSFQTYFIHHYRKNAVHQPLEPESDTFQVLYARCKRQMLPPLFARCRVTLTHGISTFAAPSKPSRWFLLPPKFTESSRSYIPHIAQGAFPRRMKGLGVLNKIRAG